MNILHTLFHRQEFQDRELIAQLGSLNLEDRMKANEHYSRLSDSHKTQIVAKLIDLLTYEASSVRCESARALGTIADPRSIEPLIDSLNDAAWNVRGFAAAALGALHDKRAVNPLINLVAIEVSQSSLLHCIEALSQLADLDKERIIDTFTRLIKHRDEHVAGKAVDALAEIGGERVIQILIDHLNHSHMVGAHAADALGKLGAKQALPQLREFAQAECSLYEDCHIRSINAAVAMTRLGDMNGLNILLQKLDLLTHDYKALVAKHGVARLSEDLKRLQLERNATLSKRIIFALGEIGDDPGKQMLKRIAHDNEVRADIRSSAATVCA